MADCEDGSDENCAQCTLTLICLLTIPDIANSYSYVAILHNALIVLDSSSVPATILTVPENVTVRAYNSTFFLCEAFSENVVVTWLFQGEPLISIEEVETSYNPESRVTTSTLTLSSPSLEDSGLYTCSVSNGVPAISPRTRQTANASLLVLSSKYIIWHAT